ncbi:hypothetical protein [Amycolatopsis japonica]
MLTLTDVREVAVLCATVSGLIRKVFGSYSRFEAFAKENNKPVGRTLTTKLGRPVLPHFHEIEAAVECCVLENPDVVKGSVLPHLRQLHDDAVRAQETKTGALEPAAASPAGDSTIVEILRDLTAANRALAEGLQQERQRHDRPEPDIPIVESTVVVPDSEAPASADHVTLQRLRALAEGASGGRAGWDLRLVVPMVLFAPSAVGLVWLGWPTWMVTVYCLLALALLSWQTYRVMTLTLTRHLASDPSGAIRARTYRMSWWLAEDEKCLTVLGPSPATRWSTALHRLVHGDTPPAATTFTGRLRTGRIAGLRPDGHRFSTAMRWTLIDLSRGDILDSGTLWSENGFTRTATITVSGDGPVGLTLKPQCPHKITLSAARFSTGLSCLTWWKDALANHTRHAHHALQRHRTAAIDRRRPDLPPAEERHYSPALQEIRRQVRSITGTAPAPHRRPWRRRS